MPRTRRKLNPHRNKFYEIFWKMLQSFGVKRVFGLPGSPIDNLLSSRPTSIAWTNTANEMSNGFMAQTYGHFADSVGYLFVTTGPGIATAISPLEQAIYEGNPLVVVTPVESSASNGSFQHWNISTIAPHLTRHVFHIRTKAHIVPCIHAAHFAAKNLCTGVILLFETDVFIDHVPRLSLSSAAPARTAIAASVNARLEDQRVVVVLGRLKPSDYPATVHFLSSTQVPFVTTSKGRFGSNLKGYCGRVGVLGKHSANYALVHATHWLVVGNISGRLNEPYKSRFSVIFEQGKTIVGLTYNQAHSLVGGTTFEMEEVSTVVRNLTFGVPAGWCARIVAGNQRLNVALAPTSVLEKYIHAMATIYKEKRLDFPVTTGVGNHWYGVSKYLDTSSPNSWDGSTVWASIGIGIANGIGVHYATGKPVWVFEGDGGALFGSTDLLYLMNNPHLPITVTIFVNHIYGANFEDYEKRLDKINDVVDVPDIPVAFPNCHVFRSVQAYAQYLSANTLCTKTRFILITVPNNHANSDIYGILSDEHYHANLLNDKFEDVLKTKQVI
jgi:thiamine pyrophosphate-dependent acetolactate synthase large subunit-like protein